MNCLFCDRAINKNTSFNNHCDLTCFNINSNVHIRWHTKSIILIDNKTSENEMNNKNGNKYKPQPPKKKPTRTHKHKLKTRYTTI